MPAALPPPIEPESPPGAFLFPDEVIKELTDEEAKHGKYTLARLPKDKEECIVQLLKERRPLRDVERMLHVHQETIRLVADKHAEEIDAAQRHFAKKLRRINWALADRLEKNADSFPLQSIPLAIKLTGEHAELLEGRATERVEEIHKVDLLEHWERFMSGQEIGLTGEKMPVLEAELVQAPACSRAVQDTGQDRLPDQESEAREASTQVNGLPMAGLVPACPPGTALDRRPADPGTPPGGASVGPHAPVTSKGKDPQKIFENGG